MQVDGESLWFRKLANAANIAIRHSQIVKLHAYGLSVNVLIISIQNAGFT